MTDSDTTEAEALSTIRELALEHGYDEIVSAVIERDLGHTTELEIRDADERCRWERAWGEFNAGLHASIDATRLGPLFGGDPAAETLDVLEDMLDLFDDVAEKHGVETYGECWSDASDEEDAIAAGSDVDPLTYVVADGHRPDGRGPTGVVHEKFGAGWVCHDHGATFDAGELERHNGDCPWCGREVGTEERDAAADDHDGTSGVDTVYDPDDPEYCPGCEVELSHYFDRLNYEKLECPECGAWKRPGWDALRHPDTGEPIADGGARRCSTCDGTGSVAHWVQTGPDEETRTERPCPDCDGFGNRPIQSGADSAGIAREWAAVRGEHIVAMGGTESQAERAAHELGERFHDIVAVPKGGVGHVF